MTCYSQQVIIFQLLMVSNYIPSKLVTVTINQRVGKASLVLTDLFSYLIYILYCIILLPWLLFVTSVMEDIVEFSFVNSLF